jgi:dolichol-phosphate mannosyltransferase
MNKKKILIVIPVFNEEYILKKLVEKLESVTGNLGFNFEFVFVNDGSTDGSLSVLLDLKKSNEQISIIDLSRNFGHQIALTAGIDHSDADAVILMDADLEDRPEDLAALIAKWQQGFDVVYAVRKNRKVSFLKNICFELFHSLNKLISESPTEASGIFAIMDRRIVEQIKKLREQNRYIPGLRSWVGFKQTSIILERGERYDKKPRVSFFRLVRLALDSYFSFSKKPLRLASLLGISLGLVSLASVIFILIFQLVYKFKVPGWASIMVIFLFISGMQFICLGIIGEYVGRIFDEARNRPLYVVKNIY